MISLTETLQPLNFKKLVLLFYVKLWDNFIFQLLLNTENTEKTIYLLVDRIFHLGVNAVGTTDI